ncbi:MAG: ribonuclease HII [Spirochaetia bacterium]
MTDCELICGVDEAGRGPLAGPVTAAAVILPRDFPRDILDDSKVLDADERTAAAAVIRSKAIGWSIGWASHEEIDAFNIHNATLLAMRRAILALTVRPTLVLVDGLFCPVCGIPSNAIVKGDATVPEIMAASIIAKTARDCWMEEYSRIEPAYGFERHKGYPTPEHRRAVLSAGPSRIQRLSFRVTAP